MFSNIGPSEILVVGGLIFLVFGGQKLNDIAKGLGESSRELKKVQKDILSVEEEVKSTLSDVEKDIKADIAEIKNSAEPIMKVQEKDALAEGDAEELSEVVSTDTVSKNLVNTADTVVDKQVEIDKND